MARRFVRSGVISSKRRTQWVAGSDETGVSNLAVGTAVVDQTFSATAEFTVVRTRGHLWISTDQAAASENPFAAIGFAVVSEPASAIGITIEVDNMSSSLWE